MAESISDLLKEARPAIQADGPDPEGRRGYRRGFGGLFGELKSDDPQFARRMYASESALFRLDTEWWPAHREAVLALIEAASVIAEKFPPAYPEGEYAAPYAHLVAALAATCESKAQSAEAESNPAAAAHKAG